jgi:hypothetical protein
LLIAFDLLADGLMDLTTGADVVRGSAEVVTTGFGVGGGVGITTEGAGGALATTGGGGLATTAGCVAAAAAADAAARRDEIDALADERNASIADWGSTGNAAGGRTGKRLWCLYEGIMSGKNRKECRSAQGRRSGQRS